MAQNPNMTTVPSTSESTQQPQEQAQQAQQTQPQQPPQLPPLWIHWAPDTILNPTTKADGSNAAHVAWARKERVRQESWIRTAMEDMRSKGAPFVGCDVKSVFLLIRSR